MADTNREWCFFLLTEYAIPEDQRMFWRLSFSFSEKKKMYNADVTWKETLRLLKEDLRDCVGTTLLNQPICSFYVKTIIIMHLMDRAEVDASEQRPIRSPLSVSSSSETSNLRRHRRYIEAPEEVIKCLREKQIEHYFIAGENLLSLKELRRGEIERVARYFERLRKAYDRQAYRRLRSLP